MRDWSEDGAMERAQSYGRVLSELKSLFANRCATPHSQIQLAHHSKVITLVIVTSQLPAKCPCELEAFPDSYGKKAGRERRLRVANIAASSSRSLFGVVRSLSPSNTEFAPAKKHNAWKLGHEVSLYERVIVRIGSSQGLMAGFPA